MQDEGVVDRGEITPKANSGDVTDIFQHENESEGELISDTTVPDVPRLANEEVQLHENEGTNFNSQARDENEQRVDASEEESEYFYRSPSTSILTNDDERAEASGSEDERESFHMRYSDLFENWQYSDDERNWLRWKVETLSPCQCVIFCILGHIVANREEMQGIRYAAPNPEDARQALLTLSLGSQWDVKNLAIIMAFQDKVNVVENYISTSANTTNPHKTRSLIRYMLIKML